MSDSYSKEEILSQISLADMKVQQGQNNEAINIYGNLLKTISDASIKGTIYHKLGNLYYNAKHFDYAIWAYEHTLKYSKPNHQIYNMLGYLYFYKDIDKSIENYILGMELKPDLKNFVMLTQVMIKSKKFSQKDLKSFFEKYIDYFRPFILKKTIPYTYNPKDFNKNKRLRIGYLSSDFYCHAMMSFVLPIIENHDLNKFDIILYSCKDNKDVVTERLQNACTEFKDCSNLTNYELSKTIHEDKIDILVDLSGYTHKNDILWTLLYKPAPVIVQYLGFLGTYGMKEVDYILADKFTIPWNIKKYYTEKPMYIDGGMNKFTFQIKGKKLPMITPLPYEENGFITFGSFNSLSKINPYTVKLWSMALKAVPNSKMLIYRTQMEQKDIERYKKEFSENGIDLNRVIFDSEKMPESHMQSYLKCDVALDPVPFSGLTITLEQAFMGVPVLTMPCDTISSKGSARVNKALGLKKFIAKNEKDFVKKAVKIASDINNLRYLRQCLPSIVENSYLCKDFRPYVEKIEKEYRKAWKKFCR